MPARRDGILPRPSCTEPAMDLDTAVNLFEIEQLGRSRLAPMARDYYASGANDEITLDRNREAFDRATLWYRVLAGVGERDTATTVLGTPLALPVMVAPTAFHRLATDAGEAATARAASGAGSVMINSTLSTTAVEDVVAAASTPVWFQLYIYRDRAATRALVQRAEQAGCQALVLTVDAPLLGRRERDVRNRFRLPDGLRIENMLAAGLEALPQDTGDSGLAAYFASLLDPGLDWSDVDWLCSITHLPVVIKGLVRADDARRAVDHGASAVVVSNHGARQLDTAPATLDALPDVAAAVGDDVEVLLDGGVRRGTDVLKALACGARAVLLGRPVLWGLAAGGERGAARVLELLHAEVDLAMALAGCDRVADIAPDLVAR